MRFRFLAPSLAFIACIAPAAAMALPVGGAGTQIEYGHANAFTSAIYYAFVTFVRSLNIQGL